MATKPKILAFAGSLRRDSYNKKLVKIAMQGAEASGADVTYIDLADYPLPVYNQDDEESSGLPENAMKLKKLLWEHDGFLISIPEYNSSISGALKNMIDWVSRKASKEEIYLSCFIGKVVMLMSASPGALGGMRCLVHVRSILGSMNALVLPQQKSIAQAANAFNEDGTLKDAQQTKEVEHLGKLLTEMVAKIK
jgi:chromate reductase, NAD(P)H dehydrogenase (quinone)